MSNSVDLKDLVFFNKQLASIIRTKLPLPEGLSVIARETQNQNLSRALKEVEDELEAGHSLSEAIERQDDTFPSLYASMVKAGEESGDLPGILAELSEYSQAKWKLERKVKIALIYPALLGVFILLYLPILSAYIMPHIISLYQSTGEPLPNLTQLLISFKNYLQSPWGLLLLLGLPLFWFIYRMLYWSSRGKGLIDWWTLSLPLFGNLVKQVELWRFNRTLGILLNAGVSLVNALELVQATSQNQLFSSAIEKLKKNVSSGKRFGEQCKQIDVFPETMTWMISMGEEQGTMNETLTELANYYDLEARLTSRKIQSLVAPVILLVLGLIVAIIVLSIFQPVVSFPEYVG